MLNSRYQRIVDANFSVMGGSCHKFYHGRSVDVTRSDIESLNKMKKSFRCFGCESLKKLWSHSSTSTSRDETTKFPPTHLGDVIFTGEFSQLMTKIFVVNAICCGIRADISDPERFVTLMKCYIPWWNLLRGKAENWNYSYISSSISSTGPNQKKCYKERHLRNIQLKYMYK